MNELTYTRCGDYYIPDLKLSEQPEAPIGKYGRMRQRYLKEHRPGLYSSLILSEKLYPHLLEIDWAARERMDAMLPRMMEAAGHPVIELVRTKVGPIRLGDLRPGRSRVDHRRLPADRDGQLPRRHPVVDSSSSGHLPDRGRDSAHRQGWSR